MVKTETLTDLSARISTLIGLTTAKIAGGHLSNLNDPFSGKNNPLTIDPKIIRDVLDGIHARLHQCQQLKLHYFDTIEHDYLSGAKPFIDHDVQYTFILPDTTLTRQFQASDIIAYNAIIQVAFQEFVLTASGWLENLVRLKETLIRKVVLFQPSIKDKMRSGTLLQYRELFDVLIDLEYWKPDDFSALMLKHKPFFEKNLYQIARLRNSFIHGFQKNTKLDNGFFEIVDYSGGKYSFGELSVEVFVKNVYTNVELLTRELLDHLITKVTDPVAKIPL